MATRAAIYARVSTDEQAEKGYSLPSQIEACREYADRHGFEVVAEFQDEYTGSKLDRPQFSVLREMIRRKEVDVLIVYSSDRLTRNLAHSLILRAEFETAGIDRHNVLRGRLEDSADGRMIENIEGVFAEYERERIRERMMRGRARKAKQGKVVGHGWTIYGYTFADGQYTISENEAKVVRTIFNWYLNGDDDGNTIAGFAIAHKLSLLAIPSPAAGRKYIRMRRDGIWGYGTIKQILRNEAYAGRLFYRKYIYLDAKRIGKRDKSEQILIAIPPIISEDVWQAAVKQREENKVRAARNRKRNYLLSGRITCSCGLKMSGCTRKRYRVPEISYYKCLVRDRRYSSLEPDYCRQSKIPAAKVEQAAWEFLYELVKDKSRFTEQLLLAKQLDEAAILPRMRDLASIEQASERTVRDMNEHIDLRRGTQDGSLQRRLIEEKIVALEKVYAELLEEHKKLSDAITVPAWTDDDIKALQILRDDIAIGLENPSFEDKRGFFEQLDLRVSVTETGDFEIVCRLGTRAFRKNSTY